MRFAGFALHCMTLHCIDMQNAAIPALYFYIPLRLALVLAKTQGKRIDIAFFTSF